MSQDIANAVQRFFASVDGRDWDAAMELMAEPFHLDYSSFGGGPAADLQPSEILGAWKMMLPGFESTHHQLGPLDIEERSSTEASVKAPVTATHYISGVKEGETWVVYGSYDIKLNRTEAGWILTSQTLNFKFVTGNGDLPALAQTRVVEMIAE